MLFVFGEAAPFVCELLQLAVAVAGGVSEPCQVEPHLQVAHFVDRKGAVSPVQLVARDAAPALVEQFPVARIRENHRVPVGGEEVVQHKHALVDAQLVGRLSGKLEECIRGLSAHILFDLHHHGGNEIESLADLRKAVENRQHIVVALDRVQAHPWHDVLAREWVFVHRLMHVPQECDEELAHGRNLRRIANSDTSDKNYTTRTRCRLNKILFSPPISISGVECGEMNKPCTGAVILNQRGSSALFLCAHG